MLILSVVACVSLLIAQIGAYLEYTLVPAPTAATTGPQGQSDLAFGLMALGGGVLGLVLSIASAIVGLIIASVERRQVWLAVIGASGFLAILALAVSAFVMLGLPRNPYDPIVAFMFVPVTAIAFLVVSRRRARD